ncbi:hypothetical protein IW262DRAFT_1034493 [Armillaria fumosa]|nr:hypothetical protein IW262DRAFT_1034493 [Armillaria fumosa]
MTAQREIMLMLIFWRLVERLKICALIIFVTVGELEAEHSKFPPSDTLLMRGLGLRSMLVMTHTCRALNAGKTRNGATVCFTVVSILGQISPVSTTPGSACV